MKNIVCVERKYKVYDSLKNESYCIVAKRELSHEITDRLLLEDVELKTFLANYDVIVSSSENMKGSGDSGYNENKLQVLCNNKNKKQISRDEKVIKIKEFIRDKWREGKDWNASELSEYTGIDMASVKDIIYSLIRREKFIVRSNPDIKAKRLYRYMKSEGMYVPGEVDKEYNIKKLQEGKKLEMGIM